MPLRKCRAMIGYGECDGCTCTEGVTVTKEVDPNGIGQHEAGAKLDSGKTDMALILDGMPRALMAVGQVGTFGAAKYTRNGWMSVAEGERRYRAAADRHRLKRFTEGEFDSDSKLLHLAHQAWNCLAELELLIKRMESEEKKYG